VNDDHRPNPLNPTAMTIRDAARLLTTVGSAPINEATIRDDLEAGAPANADGTLNLVHYAAWLMKEMSRGD
jgi:hypothetical protein